jgi:hypothetical protein
VAEFMARQRSGTRYNSLAAFKSGAKFMARQPAEYAGLTVSSSDQQAEIRHL